MSDDTEEVLDEVTGEEDGEIEYDLDNFGQEEGEEDEDEFEGMIDTNLGENFFSTWNKDTAGMNRLKVLLYGQAGTGKTTMAATFPKPIFLDLEGGLRSTLLIGDVFRYPADFNKDVKRYSQVVEFYENVARLKNPPFETIVVDSLNELQTLVTLNVVGRFTKVKRQYDDQMTLADYGKANRDYAKVVRLFLRLPYNVVFTAAATKREIGDDDTQITPKFVGRQVGPDVERMMDMIGYVYTKKVSDKQDAHMVSFKHSPNYLAKDRLLTTAKEFPNTYAELVDHIEVFRMLAKG